MGSKESGGGASRPGSAGPLKSLSPLDGRYGPNVVELSRLASEEALIGYRIRVEAAWLLHLDATPGIGRALALGETLRAELVTMSSQTHWDHEALAVKDIEKKTNHDVKAVEYFMRDRLGAAGASPAQQAFIHFGCTSEDINNVAYAWMMQDVRRDVLVPFWGNLIRAVAGWADDLAAVPMLARTHGQTASPTTFGKEWAVFGHRLLRQYDQLLDMPILAKFNGAVGNYNAHQAAFPEINWQVVSRTFLEKLGFEQNPLTTQIESHDNLIEHLDCLRRFNTILLGLCRDVWGYISLGYLKQRAVAGEVGSSTMPHKINPIDFENAEGNIGLANALCEHLAQKLAVSRWQRDLSDSTVLRNLGVVWGHSLLAYKSTLKGMGKLAVDRTAVDRDLVGAWEVMGEAVQTVMRRYGVRDAYERLKESTRGKVVDQAAVLSALDAGSEVPDDAKALLRKMTPSLYVGAAEALARTFVAVVQGSLSSDRQTVVRELPSQGETQKEKSKTGGAGR